MNAPGIRRTISVGWLAAAILLLFVPLALSDDKKQPPPKPPAPAVAKAPAPAGRPAGAAAGHGPNTATAGHGPTGHGPTTATAGHGPTTATAGHGPTTAATGHNPTITTAGHSTTTGAAGSRTTPGASAAGAKPTSTAPRSGTASTTAGGGKLPNGAKVVPTKDGGAVVRRADGKVATLHDPKRGMEIHHGLNGNRRVVERADHSRVVVERGGRGYVQRTYVYNGREYASRTYYVNGTVYNAYYANYYYRGVYVNPYVPAYYYAPAYYGWVYNPWPAPAPYAWGWASSPWYGYYGAYFTPYPVYSSASLWLTDYMIANSLAAAYQAQVDAQARVAALSAVTPLTPDVKQLISDEVRRQVALENAEAQGTARNAQPDPASSSIQRMLTDGTQHVFVAGHDLDVVNAGGTECAISEGDALRLTGETASDAANVNLVVLASKGGRECVKGDTVSVGLQDLQDMQNHMRETIGRGMQELQAKQGQGGLPAAPAAAKAEPLRTAFAASPPPENDVAAQISEQAKGADLAEKEAVSETAAAAPPTEPPTITLGQTLDEVTTAMGNPKNIVDLGGKKIYMYKDMKITFNNEKVSDVQ